MVTVQLWIPDDRKKSVRFPTGYMHIANIHVPKDDRPEWVCEAAIAETGSRSGNFEMVRPGMHGPPAREGDVLVLDKQAYRITFIGVEPIKEHV